MQLKADRMSPTYLQHVKKMRKRAAKIEREKNGQRSWLVKE